MRTMLRLRFVVAHCCIHRLAGSHWLALVVLVDIAVDVLDVRVTVHFHVIPCAALVVPVDSFLADADLPVHTVRSGLGRGSSLRVSRSRLDRVRTHGPRVHSL
jgi:hypothetical protein